MCEMLRVRVVAWCHLILAVLALDEHRHLGPGREVWNDPIEGAWEAGLSADALKAAGKAYGEIGVPFCLSIVKDGLLVLDESYGFAPDRRFETDSTGKLLTSTLFGYPPPPPPHTHTHTHTHTSPLHPHSPTPHVGAAVHRGLFDLDTPIAKYGVKPQANWSVTGTDYFPAVTARHLLAQASGVGRVAPGSFYTYDSDEYIQHLSYLLNATAGVNTTAKQWATDHFAVPLGTLASYARC